MDNQLYFQSLMMADVCMLLSEWSLLVKGASPAIVKLKTKDRRRYRITFNYVLWCICEVGALSSCRALKTFVCLLIHFCFTLYKS